MTQQKRQNATTMIANRDAFSYYTCVVANVVGSKWKMDLLPPPPKKKNSKSKQYELLYSIPSDVVGPTTPRCEFILRVPSRWHLISDFFRSWQKAATTFYISSCVLLNETGWARVARRELSCLPLIAPRALARMPVKFGMEVCGGGLRRTWTQIHTNLILSWRSADFCV